MEENHSFDNYFGTFPGANGIPAGVCVPDPATGGCDPPYHNPAGNSHDLAHGFIGNRVDVDMGRMDGFVREEQSFCHCATHESMGYFTAADIPIFWRYAQSYTLQDMLFEPSISWSFPSHLMMVSDWSAKCTSTSDPMSCTANASPADLLDPTTWPANQLPWTDLTWLLHRYGVSWGYYVGPGTEPDCTPQGCTATQSNGTPSYWNPLPWFTDVQQDGQLGNVKDLGTFYSDVSSGNLPAVSWIVPDHTDSGHPFAGAGARPNAQSEPYVVSLINAIESSSAWDSTAILLAWDDWGGEYDHVVPPKVDSLGFGLRVPGILISPYAKKGYIDSQPLSFDAYNKFIEDNFLGSQRLNPATDGRPDSRQTVRESGSVLGDLMNSFDFKQPPSAPILFPTLSVPPKVTPGGQLTVSGTNFLPGDTVSIILNCGAPDCTGGVLGATVTAAPDGTFAATFPVPATLPAGKQSISAEGSDPLTYFAVSPVAVA